MNFRFLLSLMLLACYCQLFAQTSEVGRLGDRLIFYSPFDGNSSPTTTLKRISFSEDQGKNKKPVYSKANLSYSTDLGLELSGTGQSFISFLDLEDAPEKRAVAFWFKIADDEQDTVSPMPDYRNLELFFSDKKTISLNTAKIAGKLSLMFEDRTDTLKASLSNLATLQKEIWYLLTISIDYKDKAFQTKLFSMNGSSFQEEKLNGSQVIGNTLNKQWNKTSMPPHIFLRFGSAKRSTICVNDLRFYERLLEEVDYRRLSAYTIDSYIDIAKYELAFTYKKVADEYFIAGKIKLAQDNYRKASEMFSPTSGKAINFENLQEVNDLYATYYKLLDKDIQYRQSLVEQGYSFWGQDFSSKPLFPVNELNDFKRTYKNFQDIYGSIEKSLDKIEGLNEEQMKQNISKITKSYESDIASTQAQEKNYKIDFYQDQENSISGRLAAISFRNKQIENEVKSKNNELAANEAKMSSAVMSMITQSVTGVPIDPSKNVGDNLKVLGTSLISSNPDLRNSLLGSQNDLVNLTNVSIDYYQKSKTALKAIDEVVKGDISADNLLSIGNTMANLDIIPKENWKSLEQTYQQVKKNTAQLKDFEKEAKKLIAVASFAKNPNIENISQFMEWVSNTDYFPQGKGYSGIYTQVCENLRRKKYDSFFELGAQVISKSEAAAELKKNIAELKSKYYQLRPITAIIERIERDTQHDITNALGDVLLNKDFWPQIKDFKIQRFMMSAISNTLAAANDIETKKKLLTALLQKTPDICLNFIPPRAKEDIKLLFDIQDDNALISKFRQASLVIGENNDLLVVKVGNQELFSIQRDSILVSDRRFMFVYNSLEKQSYDYLTVLNQLFSDKNLREGVMRQVAVSDWYNFLGPKNIANPELIYDKIFANLKVRGKTEVLNAIKSDGFQAYVGANVFQSYQNDPQIPKKPPMLDPEEFYHTEDSGDGKGAAARAAAASAIDMAFPGYGTVANKVLDIVGNILDSYDLIDQLKDLYNEQKMLHKELLEQLEKLKANSFNKKIAFFEKDIAELNLELAKKQKEEFSKMEFDLIADKQIEKRNKLSYQLPIFFYYAERLRYYNNRLFRASTFWYGPKNTLADIIESDQSNIRLALDQSVNLYNWIKQPDITSMRQDVDKIENYWRSQFSLITDPETEEKIKYGSMPILSHTFSLDKTSAPFALAWDKFLNWRESVKNKLSVDEFTFDLDLGNYMEANVKEYDKNDVDPKIIDIAIAGINKQNGLVNSPSPNLEVFHPGISIKKDGSILVLEERKSAVNATKLEVATDKTLIISQVPKSLQERWEPNTYKAKTFEGYDLNTKWKVRVKPNIAAADIDNIILQISYQYRNTGQISDPQSASSYRVSVEYNNSLKQNFRMDLTPEKAGSMAASLKEAVDAKKIRSGKIDPIVNLNKTTDVLSN
ncbi:hypothetical protein [Pedobacter sp.]|jgi:hypothetical protein|uniref:hypothetical protein n=1 Tax=Pedobacter sp. TaxID=1411316 RepID=UPI002CB50372|nr:hypothetical protein [Pedobacter sp.]HWW41504.1 hypothetical protein [Pedobacter sp.]